MKILHIADAHYARRFGSGRLMRAAVARRGGLTQTITRLFDYANAEGVDYILSAGDLIHESDARTADLKSLADAAARLKARLICVCGNHDPAGANSVYARARLPQNVVVAPAGYSRLMLDAETALHLYSFPQSSVRENPLSGLTLDLGARRNLLLIHCDALSAESDYLPLSPAFLQALGFDYCALGHVHKPTALAKNIVYPGSLDAQDPSETGPHGFVQLEIGAAVEARFVPFSRLRYESLAVPVRPEMSDLAVEEAVRAALTPLGREALYTVRLEGLRAADSRLDAEELAARLEAEGYALSLTDATHPAFDAEALLREHGEDAVGQFIASFSGEMSDLERRALDLGLEALWEGMRHED